jgi:hypothetical protein
MPTQTRYIKATAGGSTPLNTSNVYKTGQVTSYISNDDGSSQIGRGNSFLTLEHNNGFGNNNRFTDTLGTQSYADDIVIDWSSWNQVANTVNGFYRIKQGGTNTMYQNIFNQPYTVGAYSDWLIPNNNEFLSIYNWSVYRDYLNYSPFNLPVGSTNTRMQTRTLEDATRGFLFNGISGIILQGTSVNMSYFLIRYFTLTELGL